MRSSNFPFLRGLIAAAGLILFALGPVSQARAMQASGELTQRRLPTGADDVLLSYAPVVSRVAPAVVNIYTAKKVPAPRTMFDSPLFRRFMGEDFSFGAPRERVQRSLGSGVIVRADGIIMTNAHVIGDADLIKVVLADRREFDAEIVLSDPRTDLAVLRIDAGGVPLPAAELAENDDIEVGDIVLAIGNPFGIGQTVTSGIVSAKARTQVGINDFGFFIQTDAAVNPGNSGGALVDLKGRTIGINTAIFSRTGDTSGIGFAIPAAMVRTILANALKEGEVIRTWIGLSGQVVDSDLAAAVGLDRPGGVLVTALWPDGPAANAGLREGDVILSVDGEEVVDARGLRFLIATRAPGTEATIGILRDGERMERKVMVAPLPDTPARDTTLLSGRHPFEGVTIANLSPRYAEELGLDPMTRGVVIAEIAGRSPAGRYGFVRPGDILLILQGREIESVADVRDIIGQPWESWVYRVARGGRHLDCAIYPNGGIECRQVPQGQRPFMR
ncbi:MAG: Do family serine endopeptidase [Rhodothalassiaceae bacterium]